MSDAAILALARAILDQELCLDRTAHITRATDSELVAFARALLAQAAAPELIEALQWGAAAHPHRADRRGRVLRACRSRAREGNRGAAAMSPAATVPGPLQLIARADADEIIRFAEHTSGGADALEVGILRGYVRMLCNELARLESATGIAERIHALASLHADLVMVTQALADRIAAEATPATYGYASVHAHLEDALMALGACGGYDDDELAERRCA